MLLLLPLKLQLAELKQLAVYRLQRCVLLQSLNEKWVVVTGSVGTVAILGRAHGISNRVAIL